MACQEGNLVQYSECGVVEHKDICERGCVDDIDGPHCCRVGTLAVGNVCVEQVEPMPDQGEDSMTVDEAGQFADEAEPHRDAEEVMMADNSEFASDSGPATDGLAETIAHDVDSGGNGGSKSGGCTTTSEESQSGLAVVLLAAAMALLFGIRRRRIT